MAVTLWDCWSRNGTYRCAKEADHTGLHACYVLGGKVMWRTFDGPVRLKRVPL